MLSLFSFSILWEYYQITSDQYGQYVEAKWVVSLLEVEAESCEVQSCKWSRLIINFLLCCIFFLKVHQWGLLSCFWRQDETSVFSLCLGFLRCWLAGPKRAAKASERPQSVHGKRARSQIRRHGRAIMLRRCGWWGSSHFTTWKLQNTQRSKFGCSKSHMYSRHHLTRE